jgi:hypothetical protein
MRSLLRLRSFLLLILLCGLLTLTTVSYWALVDPTWIPGLYDDGDYDVLLIPATSPDAGLAHSTLIAFTILLIAGGRVLLADGVPLGAVGLPAVSIRSPPLL